MSSMAGDRCSEDLICSVEIPFLDYTINDPFHLKLSDIVVEPITGIRIEVELPPIYLVEPPIIEEELIRITIIEEYLIRGISFEDVLTAVPMIYNELVTVTDHAKKRLEHIIKKMRRIMVTEPLTRFEIRVRPLEKKNIPEEIRDSFGIKIRIKKDVSPELREILMDRLTKELKITRLVRRMEIVRDDRYLIELEILLREIERRLGLRRLGGRSPRREH